MLVRLSMKSPGFLGLVFDTRVLGKSLECPCDCTPPQQSESIIINLTGQLGFVFF